MWNEPSPDQLKTIPGLYETEEVRLEEKNICLHFFIGSCDWYIAEYDGQDIFWGFTILNDDFQMAEWGYISFEELKSIKIQDCFEIECDEYWKVRKAIEIDRIRKAQGWRDKWPTHPN